MAVRRAASCPAETGPAPVLRDPPPPAPAAPHAEQAGEVKVARPAPWLGQVTPPERAYPLVHHPDPAPQAAPLAARATAPTLFEATPSIPAPSPIALPASRLICRHVYIAQSIQPPGDRARTDPVTVHFMPNARRARGIQDIYGSVETIDRIRREGPPTAPLAPYLGLGRAEARAAAELVAAKDARRERKPPEPRRFGAVEFARIVDFRSTRSDSTSRPSSIGYHLPGLTREPSPVPRTPALKPLPGQTFSDYMLANWLANYGPTGVGSRPRPLPQGQQATGAPGPSSARASKPAATKDKKRPAPLELAAPVGQAGQASKRVRFDCPLPGSRPGPAGPVQGSSSHAVNKQE